MLLIRHAKIDKLGPGPGFKECMPYVKTKAGKQVGALTEAMTRQREVIQRRKESNLSRQSKERVRAEKSLSLRR